MAAVTNLSTQLAGETGTFSGGLGGAPTQLRSTWRAKPTRHLFSYAQGASAGNVGDQIVIAYAPPTAVLYDWYIAYSAMGTSATFSLGKIDPNYPAGSQLTAAAFDAAFSVAAAGTHRFVGFPGSVADSQTLNTPGYGIGNDPEGDGSTDQGIPNYGSAWLSIVIVDAATAIPASATFTGWVDLIIGN